MTFRSYRLPEGSVQTKLKQEFEQAGVRQEDVEFDIAIAKYLNSGGTLERAYQRLMLAAKRMPGEGHNGAVGNDHDRCAPSRQPVEDAAGHSFCAPDGCDGHALASSSNPSGDGQKRRAQDGHSEPALSAGAQLRGGEGRLGVASNSRPLGALPVRDASTKRGLVSIKSVQPTIKQGLLEMKKTADGRAWGSVGWHELDGMDRDGAIARLVKQQVNPPRDQFSPLRSFVSNKQFEEIVSAAQKQNDFV
jgi:hypothetical protein